MAKFFPFKNASTPTLAAFSGVSYGLPSEFFRGYASPIPDEALVMRTFLD